MATKTTKASKKTTKKKPQPSELLAPKEASYVEKHPHSKATKVFKTLTKKAPTKKAPTKKEATEHGSKGHVCRMCEVINTKEKSAAFNLILAAINDVLFDKDGAEKTPLNMEDIIQGLVFERLSDDDSIDQSRSDVYAQILAATISKIMVDKIGYYFA
jgi:hypothetical protein